MRSLSKVKLDEIFRAARTYLEINTRMAYDDDGVRVRMSTIPHLQVQSDTATCEERNVGNSDCSVTGGCEGVEDDADRTGSACVLIILEPDLTVNRTGFDDPYEPCHQ